MLTAARWKHYLMHYVGVCLGENGMEVQVVVLCKINETHLFIIKGLVITKCVQLVLPPSSREQNLPLRRSQAQVYKVL